MKHARKLFERIKAFAANVAGTAGLEFAICAPILLGGLILMTDIGLAINVKMNLDQSVKSGAQFVMGDVTNEDDLGNLMMAAATGAAHDDVRNVNNEAAPEFTALRSCKCPGSNGTVSCDSLCTADQTPPRIFYDITGTQTYEAMALPDSSSSRASGCRCADDRGPPVLARYQGGDGG
jgi:hypothetical protein